MKLFTIFFLSLLVISCGMFRKTLNKSTVDFEKELLEVTREQKDVEVKNRDAYAEILEITIRKHAKEVEGVKTPEMALYYEDLHGAILQQILESSEILIRSERRGRSTGESRDQSIVESRVEASEKKTVKMSDLNKDSNTSLISNIPWYVFLLVSVALLGMLYAFLKKYRVL